MTRGNRSVIALLLVALLGACTAPMDAKIDASTQAAYDRSLKSIEAKLTPEEAKRLQQAIAVLTFGELFGASNNVVEALAKLARSGLSPAAAQARALAVINGKTPRELIAAAHDQIVKGSQAELDRVSAEITQLEQKKSTYEAARPALDKIAITDARYYWSRPGNGGPTGYLEQPTLEFAVANGTTTPLSRIYCHGIVSSPGRAIPWVEEDFDSALAGGLEPGEVRRLLVMPGMLWGPPETKERKDLVLTVVVVNAEGPHGEKLAEPFDKDDARRLEEDRPLRAELERKLAALSVKR